MVNQVSKKAEPKLHGFFPSMLLLCSMPLILLSRLPYTLLLENVVYIQLVLALICHFYLFIRLKNSIDYRRYILFISLVSFVLIINVLLVGNTSIKQFFYGSIIFSSTALLVFYVRLNRFWCYLLFFYALSIIVIRWFVLDLGTEEITINSRNYIVYYLFLYSLPYYCHCYNNEKQPNFIFPVICLVISVLAIGRGGIIMSVVLLLGWLYSLRSLSKSKFIIMILLVAFVLLYFFSEMDQDVLDFYFDRFERKGVESEARTIGWNEYINSLGSPFNFILGSPINALPYVRSELEGSLHNSYFTLHARLGLFAIIYMFLIIKSLFILYWRKSFFLLFFFGAVAIKGYADADFPGVPVGGDVNMYVLLLFGLLLSSNRTRNNPKSERLNKELSNSNKVYDINTI